MNILELKGVTLSKDGRKLLDDFTMDVWDGQVHAVIGPNGAGKSTLANTIMGLSGYRDFSGDIVYKGESLKPFGVDERAKRGLTLLFQEPARFEGLGVAEFILAGAADKSQATADKALEMVGLDPARYRGRAVDKTLSGGERKRIELASIQAMRPNLVLMDEPDSGVDIDSVKYIFDIIQELKREGSTVILITHSPEVLKQADHAFLICGGCLVDKGPMGEMLDYFSGKCLPCKHIGIPASELAATNFAS